MKTYQDRVWLNKHGNPSSGSVMAYHGPAPWDRKKTMSVLEVSDCHGKIRLHRSEMDSNNDFVRKLRKLAKVISKFADMIDS